MVIRPYSPADRAALRALHKKHGENFWFADPEDPANVLTLVVEDDAGQIIAATTGRQCLEAYLMLDPKWASPQERWALIQKLAEVGGRMAYDKGYREIHHHTFEKSYARRLSHLFAFFVDKRFRVMQNLWWKYEGSLREAKRDQA